MEIDQTFINWTFGVVSALLGAILHALWQAVKELQKEDKDLAEKVSNIQVLVAGDYVKKPELNSIAKALFTKLDRIEDKLERKRDKDEQVRPVNHN